MRSASRSATAGLIVLVAALLACGKADPSSTAYCKGAPSGDECGECCKTRGKNSHRYIQGKCECL